jgi:hypothetical protein
VRFFCKFFPVNRIINVNAVMVANEEWRCEKAAQASTAAKTSQTKTWFHAHHDPFR